MWMYLTSASPVYMQDLNLIITVAADGLAPLGARPSAATVLTEKFNMRCVAVNDLILIW